jgi:translation initiation factor 2 beta subunit (eIF-2beta)/eIF-5
MESMLGISLYSYLYLKLAKMLCLSYYVLCFLFNKIEEEEDGTGSAREQGGWGIGAVGRRWHKQCIHMLVNVKMIKGEKNKDAQVILKKDFLNSHLYIVIYFVYSFPCSRF